MHRFPNGGVPVGGSLFWDVLGIHREVLAGVAEVARTGELHGIGIDSWAVDYGLLDRDGELLGNPYSHRDPRTRDVPELVARTVSVQEQYAVNGLQQLPFTTVFQLAAARGTAALESAHTMLLLPDLLGYWLTGEVGAERTNASTTGLLDVRTGEWSSELAGRLELPWSILPPLRDAGSVVGPLPRRGRGRPRPRAGRAGGGGRLARHRLRRRRRARRAGTSFGYISSGTWSLVGLELDAPVLTEEAREADFTNEGGVDGTVRFLKNVMGLWVLSECLRAWRDRGTPATDLASLLADASTAAPLRTVVDINHPSLLGPGSATDPMPERVVRLARDAGEPLPQTPGEITRCILDSLALAYRRHLRTAARLAGRDLEVVHVVGGGSHNHLLCQLTADALGVPVLAGPVEAAALGNVLVQARALGADLPDLAAMRALVRETHDVRRHDPRPGLDWDAADRRVGDRDDGRMPSVRVALQVTCVNDAMFPDTGKAVVRLLRRLGVEVDFPPAQTCCGQPMVNTGYLDEAVPVVRTFVDAFAGYDAIVTPSGSCAGSARHQHSIVADRSGDPALVAAVAETGPRTYELSEFLVDVLGVTDVGAYFPHRVTYHPTCHTLRMLGVGDRPTRLLEAGPRHRAGRPARRRPSAAASAAPSRSRTPTRRSRWAPTRPATCATPAPRCWSPATTPA